MCQNCLLRKSTEVAHDSASASGDTAQLAAVASMQSSRLTSPAVDVVDQTSPITDDHTTSSATSSTDLAEPYLMDSAVQQSIWSATDAVAACQPIGNSGGEQMTSKPTTTTSPVRRPFGPIFGAHLPATSVPSSKIDKSAMTFGQALIRMKAANCASTRTPFNDDIATSTVSESTVSPAAADLSDQSVLSACAVIASDSSAADVVSNSGDDVD